MNITKVAGYVGAVYGSLELYSDIEHYKDLRRKHRER